jgi:FkbM family methyltransferase
MKESLWKLNYEGGELEIVSKTLNPEDIILELGTGLGLLSAYVAKKIGDQNVYTFEANSQLKDRIELLYQMNNVHPNIEFKILDKGNGFEKFYVEPNDIWSSSKLGISKTSKLISIEKLDINEFIKKYQPTYLIMDIEGAEADLIPHIQFESIKKIQVEIHTKFIGSNQTQNLIEILEKNGFRLNMEHSREEQYYFHK